MGIALSIAKRRRGRSGRFVLGGGALVLPVGVASSTILPAGQVLPDASHDAGSGLLALRGRMLGPAAAQSETPGSARWLWRFSAALQQGTGLRGAASIAVPGHDQVAELGLGVPSEAERTSALPGSAFRW